MKGVAMKLESKFNLLSQCRALPHPLDLYVDIVEGDRFSLKISLLFDLLLSLLRFSARFNFRGLMGRPIKHLPHLLQQLRLPTCDLVRVNLITLGWF